MFTHYNNRQLAEDLEKKLLLYSDTNYMEDFGQSFNKERYKKFVNIIINKYSADIDNLINQLVRYYKSGIEFKDGKLSFDYSEVHLIGSLLYKELFYIDSETAFSQYLELIKTKVHGDMEWWLDIYFDNDGIKNNFLDNATDYIIEHQNKEWITEFSKIDYKRYSWLPNIKNIPEIFHDNNQLYFWLKGDYRNTKEEVLHFIGNSLVSSLLQKVILLESYNTHQINRNRILNILDACQNDYITVGTILVHNDIKLNVFLLTQFDYNLFAFLNLYDIDSAPHSLSDSEINYTQQWEEIVTKQLVNIFFIHFRSHNKEQFSEMLFHTINNLAVRYFHNTNNFKIKNTLFTVLEKTSEFQRKSYSEKEYLFDIVISDLVSKQLSNLISDDNFKIENLFILSYYLEQLNTKSKIFNSDYSALSDNIISGILEYLEVVLLNNNLHIRDLDNLEKINFGLMYELSSNKNDWLKIIDLNLTMEQWQNIIDEEKIKKVLSSSDPRKPREVVEIYFQILLIIFKDLKDNKIAKIISSLAIKFGLKIEYGIFDDSPWRNNQLYVKYIETLNVFEDSLFEDFINNLQKHKRLKDMLKLLSYTVAINRQENIQSKIEVLAKDVLEDNISYFDMREAIQYAMHSDFDDLATNLITIYQDKIEKTGYKHKEKEFYEIVCRKELLDIFYSDIIVLNDKFNQLNAYKIPFDDRNHGIESKQKRCENYKTFIRALLFFETEPIKTYKILENLLEEELNSQYLINMLSAYFKAYEKDYNKVEKFKYILDEFEVYQKRLKPYSKSMHEYSTLLYGYTAIGDEEKFNYLWKEMSLAFQYDINIFEIRCEFLQDINQSFKAKEYINEFKQYRQDLTSDELEIVKQMEIKLDENINIQIENKLQIEIVRQSLNVSLKEAKRNWLDIKDMSSEEHAKIFSNKENLNEFIVDMMLNISKELLNRRINLTREVKRGLELEDIINDWVTSLLNQKMSFLNWSARDQTRGGTSSSGKNVGEKDLEVYDTKGEKLFVFEAFRLFSVDTTTINEHINKLNGYNANGCQTVIVMIYSNVNDFVSLCTNYQGFLKTFDYKGFDNLACLKTHSLDEIDSSSTNIKLLKEVRLKNNTPINIYHYLLDFKD